MKKDKHVKITSHLTNCPEDKISYTHHISQGYDEGGKICLKFAGMFITLSIDPKVEHRAADFVKFWGHLTLEDVD